MNFETLEFQSPVGRIVLEASSKGLTKVSFKSGKAKASKTSNKHLLQAKAELLEYFAGQRRGFDVALDAQGTGFQTQVWNELRRIPFGKTRAYGEVAERIGRPKASRAVGMANNKNPIAIVVPCHRVVGKSGDLVGYAGGLGLKRKLLALEGVL